MANINVQNKNGETPLHIAVENGHINIVKLLISSKADVNVRDKNGDTPLHVAVFTERIDIAKLLISKKADVNIGDKDGNTPLHSAVRADRIDIVKLLIFHKADVNVKDKYGNILSDMTLNDKIINLFLPEGAGKSKDCLTPSTSLSMDRKKGSETAFPTYEEFRQFLEKNRKKKFDQEKYYTCAMSVCTGGTVSEGYGSDVDINAPTWFKEFENLTTWERGGIWTGAQLLKVLKQIDPMHPSVYGK